MCILPPLSRRGARDRPASSAQWGRLQSVIKRGPVWFTPDGPSQTDKKLSAGVFAEGENKIQSLFRGRVPRKSTLRAELGPDPFSQKSGAATFLTQREGPSGSCQRGPLGRLSPRRLLTGAYPNTTSSASMMVNPAAKDSVPRLEWFPAEASGINSSTTT